MRGQALRLFYVRREGGLCRCSGGVCVGGWCWGTLLAAAQHPRMTPWAPIPTLLFLLSPGLAVHQIITITVSLIMVIAALITTLVLKNW